jgi:hypothetical protein
MGNNNKYLTSPGRMSLPITEHSDYGQEDDVSSKFHEYNTSQLLYYYYLAGLMKVQ